MAYQVLARRWRPQRFEELRGQEHVVRALTNALRAGRVAHAYLFSGIRGVGKTSAARILAKALNCQDGPGPEPCNNCPQCEEITAGTHPDVFEIDGASNTGVDDVRRLREGVRYPPVRGAYRVYIIDEVHMLSTAAFNALLKTLEEPPDHVVFVFATTDPHKVPPTIRSRCQQFDFRRLSQNELVAIIGGMVKAEGVEADPRALAAIAREADGSVRDAQSLLDQVIAYTGDRITADGVRDVLGVVDRELLLALARGVVRRDAPGVLRALDRAWRFGADPGRLALDLLEVFRDLCVLAAVDSPDGLVDLTPEEVEEVRDFLGEAGWEDLHARFEMLASGVDALRGRQRPDLLLEMTLLKMARLPPLVRVADLLRAEATGGADTRPRSRRPPPSAPPDQGVPAGESEDPGPREPAGSGGEEAGEPWERLLETVRERHRALWSVLKEHGRMGGWNPEQGTLVLEVEPAQMFFVRDRAAVLERAAAAALGNGRQVKIEIRGAGAGPAQREASRGTDRSRRLQREALDHPLVRDALDVFDGIVENVRVLKP